MIQQLISIETHVHYAEPPPPGVEPFIAIIRNSPILISAPHGTRTFRNNSKEVWHEEDEYTAAMALLISQRSDTSVIANIWRSDLCDPNEHDEERCNYKRRLRERLRIQAVQIEMRPSVRVPLRRTDASSYIKYGPFSAPPDKVIAMIQALEDFVGYLKQLPQS